MICDFCLSSISANLKNVVYCTAISVGGQDEWDFAWQRYRKTNVGSEKDILLGALGCSRETWILSRYCSLHLIKLITKQNFLHSVRKEGNSCEYFMKVWCEELKCIFLKRKQEHFILECVTTFLMRVPAVPLWADNRPYQTKTGL